MAEPKIEITREHEEDTEDGKPIFNVKVGGVKFTVCSTYYVWRHGQPTWKPIGHDLQIWPEGFDKDSCAKALGLKTYDFALPQQWLDKEAHKQSGIPPQDDERFHKAYFRISCETVWCYDNARSMGEPVNVVWQVEKLITDTFHKLAEARKW